MQRRPEGRLPSELRAFSVETGLQRNAAGSVLIANGATRIICAATVEKRAPKWMKDDSRGWVTAEYGMMPASGDSRIRRGTNARATEIQRLIARSLRGAVDLKAMAGYTITIDCDVLEADGGTRTASITGGWITLYQACRGLVESGALPHNPIVRQVAAVSVGMVSDNALLDLDYIEDSGADVDLNVVGTENRRLIEIQGTAEGDPFDRHDLEEMLDLAQSGIASLLVAQKQALGIS